MMLPSDQKILRLTWDAMFLVAALMLSALEHLLPLSVLLPLPGMKLGLANLAVLACAYTIGLGDAGCVSMLRCLLMGLLFGSGVSMLFSLSGAVLSFCVLFLLRIFSPWLKNKISFAGISILCAAGHNLGQILCAGVMYGWTVSILRMYGGVLLVSGTIFGLVGGLLLNGVFTRISRNTRVK